MITIKPMNSGHISQIAEMEKELFSDGWSESSIRSELENDLALWLVACDDQTVTGYVGSQTVMGEADMLNLAVRLEYRRQGIGRKLIESLIEQLNAHCLTLEVRPSNVSAIALYRSMGFIQVGCRKNYYEKPKEDGLILRKDWER